MFKWHWGNENKLTTFMCNIETLPFQVDLRELKNLRNTKTRLSSTIKEENEAKKKENDTFGRFPVLRNANLLEFNFKVRETKQKKNLLEKQKKSTTLTFRFSFRPPLCAEREKERNWEGGLRGIENGKGRTETPTTNSAYKRAHNELHRACFWDG